MSLPTNSLLHFARLLIGSVALCGVIHGAQPGAASTIDYNRQVRPILSDNCFKCHEPDEGSREAKLRLDQRETATRPAKSGEIPIVPGDLKRSEMVLRITAEDEMDIMPPVDSGKKLKLAEITGRCTVED